jgi:hypothetical protein
MLSTKSQKECQIYVFETPMPEALENKEKFEEIFFRTNPTKLPN